LRAVVADIVGGPFQLEIGFAQRLIDGVEPLLHLGEKLHRRAVLAQHVLLRSTNTSYKFFRPANSSTSRL